MKLRMPPHPITEATEPMSLMTIVLLGLTALIAGLIPTLLFFGTAADKRVVILGGLAVTLAYLPPALGLPALVAVGANGLQFYPAWAILIAFPVAAVWKLVQRAGAPPKTEEERAAEIREKARARAEALRRERGESS